MSHTPTCERDAHSHGSIDGAPLDHSAALSPAPRRERSPGRAGLWSQREVGWAGASLVLFLVGLSLRSGGGGWDAAVCFAACYLAGGWEPALAGLTALWRRSLDVDLLMVVAAVLAASIGQVVDGALLIVIFSTSGALEAVSTRRTREAVRSLLTLAPEQANLVVGEGREAVVRAAQLMVGDVIVVRPGERIAADGRVIAGASDVDQASITGEPLPVAKWPGDQVYAGTLNGSGALRVEVTRPAGESVVARIVALVEEASQTTATTQLFIERVEQRYSAGMVVVTLGLFAVPLLLGAAFRPTLLRAMTFMIVASPCAVVLATMPPLLAAIANCGRHGVLVKSAVVMEQLARISQVAFDKTGTLTKGAPRLHSLHLVAPAVAAEEVIALAAGAENPSEHPLARAVVAEATARGLVVPEASAFAAQPGRGVTAVVEGRLIEVGRPHILADMPAEQASGPRRVAADMERCGQTAVIVAADRVPLAVLGFADRLRPDAAVAVAALDRLTDAPAVLVTGDNALAAGAVAAEAGIGDVRASLLPEQKVAEVRALQAGGRRVALVGDGVNDAPALATADVGVAMGRHGSDLALETADVVVVRDELSALPAAVKLSREAARLVKANLAFAAVVIAVLVGIDLTGHLPLPLGVAGHEGSTVVVGLNGLRLLRARHWRP